MSIMRSKVITLSQDQFRKDCLELGERIMERGVPDLVILVPRAGDVIGAELKKHSQFSDITFVRIKAQRALTKYKSRGHTRRVLSLFPLALKDILRQTESGFRESVFRLTGARSAKALEYSDNVPKLIKAANMITIVDDAIDSGETVKSIIDFVRRINFSAPIQVAVITTTFNAPLIVADISLYTNQIIRFPWSEDYA